MAYLGYAIRNVSKKTELRDTPNPPKTDDARLDSWKEIAGYLGRGVRTVQRWEREEGLPVHRLSHSKRGTVYAYREELTGWRQRREEKPGPKPISAASKVGERLSAPRLERVTTASAATFSPALSSDARLVVYVSDYGRDGEPAQIYVQQIGGGALRLTSRQRECADPTFSADNTRVIFTARSEASRNLYEIPTFGGEPRLLKRAVKTARFSPDGKWLAYVSLDPPGCLRLAKPNGGDDREFPTTLLDVSCMAWSPDSRHLLALAHSERSVEPDYWILPMDEGAPVDSGILRRLRPAFKPLDCPPAWIGDAVVFSASTRDGTNLWLQPLNPQTFQAQETPVRLTPGADLAWFPATGAGRLAFVSTRHDMNLWSVAIDAATGRPYGPLRRLTRGPGILGHLSLTSDGRTLAYFTTRRGKPELYLRDLEAGSERDVAVDAEQGNPGSPSIAPGGTQLAYGWLAPGPPVKRPISVIDLGDGTTRRVREDCGGRPRQWLDDRYLLLETFGSPPSRLLVLDTVTSSQTELLVSSELSLSNPSVSPDAAWIAFDAVRRGESPVVYVAPNSRKERIPESFWIAVEAGSHPFWSRDGQLLYYLSLKPNSDIRGAVRARRLDLTSGRPEGEAVEVLRLTEMLVPTLTAGTAPICAPDQIVFVLGDFRGDIWTMDL
jgi:Tol biopolymer transport system component